VLFRLVYPPGRGSKTSLILRVRLAQREISVHHGVSVNKFCGINVVADTKQKVTSSIVSKTWGIFGGGAEQKRLRSIRSVFPHEDCCQISNITEIYAEALQYFRFVTTQLLVMCLPHIAHIEVISPGSRYYDSKTTIANSFLTQIRTGNIQHLKIALRDLSFRDYDHLHE